MRSASTIKNKCVLKPYLFASIYQSKQSQAGVHVGLILKDLNSLFLHSQTVIALFSSLSRVEEIQVINKCNLSCQRKLGVFFNSEKMNKKGLIIIKHYRSSY